MTSASPARIGAPAGNFRGARLTDFALPPAVFAGALATVLAVLAVLVDLAALAGALAAFTFPTALTVPTVLSVLTVLSVPTLSVFFPMFTIWARPPSEIQPCGAPKKPTGPPFGKDDPAKHHPA